MVYGYSMISPVNSILSNLLAPGVVPSLPRPSRRSEETVPSNREPSVSTDLTPAAVRLSEESLDFARSSITTASTDLEFNLEFTSNSLERLSATGYYAEESQSLSLSLSYTFQREVIVKGRTQVRTFEASLDVKVSRLQVTAASPFARKEDIMALVRQLLNDISRVTADDGKLLGGVVIDRQDFLDLVAVDSGRLAKKLEALIQLTVMLARLKQLLDDEDAELVILNPQRQETGGWAVVDIEERLESFRLVIRDITAESDLTENGSDLESTTEQADASEGNPTREPEAASAQLLES